MVISVIPEWLGSAVLGGILALLGYVGTHILQWLLSLRSEERRRRARLAELLALIRAGDIAWKIQAENRDRLYEMVRHRDPGLASKTRGYDHIFAAAYESMLPSERELFDVVRAITVHTFQPLNEAILKWLRSDEEFRVRRPDDSLRGRLAAHLRQLEAHLLLWNAKYRIWIPEHPEHALVYLADEERHGIEFPKGGAELIERILRSSRWIGA